MSLMLERGFGGPVGVALAVALVAATLALFPAAAGAQIGEEQSPSVVVRPGDSLWSISEERLGPNASPRRIMNVAGRIHALNRARIGDDPELILVGQELSMPRATPQPSTAGTTPARKAAGAGREDLTSGGSAGKRAPREASRQGAIPRSGTSLAKAAGMPGADTEGREALPDTRAVAPVPAVRMVALKDAHPGSSFGDAAEARPEGRHRLLGLGIMALTPAVAALAAACVRRASRRKARERELRFRETYGPPDAAPDPFVSHEGASRRASEVRGGTPSPDGPTNAEPASKDRPDRMDPYPVARSKRARVRQKWPPGLFQQSPRVRVWRLRRLVRPRSQRKPLSGGRRATTRARHKEWEPTTAFVSALGRLPLQPTAGLGENLAGLRPHLEEALGELRRLEWQGGLSERERTRKEALGMLLASIEQSEE